MKKLALSLLPLLLACPAWAVDMSNIAIHGFVSQGYMYADQYGDAEDGTFQFNEIGINFTTTPVENLRIGLQLLSRDLGSLGNNEVTLDWAYADWSWRNWLGVRAGKMKQRFGLFNQERDVDAARLPIFLPSAVYEESYREVVSSIMGIGAYGTLPAGFSYEIQCGSLTIDDEGGLIQELEVAMGMPLSNPESDPVNVDMGLLWETPLEGLEAGITFADVGFEFEAPMGTVGIDARAWVFSTSYRWRDLQLAAEYRRVETDMELAGITLWDGHASRDWYVSAGYRLTDWLEVGTYYAEAYPDEDDMDGDRYEIQGKPRSMAWLKDLAVSARFDINEYWIVKLEGHFMNGLKGVPVDPADSDPDDDWYLFAAKTTFNF